MQPLSRRWFGEANLIFNLDRTQIACHSIRTCSNFKEIVERNLAHSYILIIEFVLLTYYIPTYSNIELVIILHGVGEIVVKNVLGQNKLLLSI